MGIAAEARLPGYRSAPTLTLDLDHQIIASTVLETYPGALKGYGPNIAYQTQF